MTAAALLGPDCSNVNGHAINGAQVKGAGCGFLAYKVTQGAWFVDGLARANDAQAKQHGLLPIRYAFLESATGGRHPASGAAQVDAFIAQIERLGGPNGCGHALDVELQAPGLGPSYRVVVDAVARWHQRMPGHPLGVYSGGWYWGNPHQRGYLGNPAFVGDWLWDANYVSGRGDPRSILHAVTPGWWVPWGGRAHYTLRQFTSSSSLGGISPLDCSVFYGSVADLRALVVGGGGPAPAPHPKPSPTWHPPAEVVALQHAWHVPADGHWGSLTDAHGQALRSNRHDRVEQAAVGTTVDGLWGKNSQTAYLAAVRATQRALGVRADGAWGKVTDKAWRTARARYYGH